MQFCEIVGCENLKKRFEMLSMKWLRFCMRINPIASRLKGLLPQSIQTAASVPPHSLKSRCTPSFPAVAML